MPESLKLKFVGQNICDLLNICLQNQFFLRYIAYLTDDPLAQQTLDRNNTIVNQPDVNSDNLRYKNIILGDVDTSIVTDLKVIVFLHPYKGDFPIDKGSSSEIFCLDVVYPYIYNEIRGQGQLRPYMIGQYFFEEIDRQFVTGVQRVFLKGYIENRLDIANYGVVTFPFTISNSVVR